MLDLHRIQSQHLIIMVEVLVLPVKPGVLEDRRVGIALTRQDGLLPLHHLVLRADGHMQHPWCIYKEKQNQDPGSWPWALSPVSSPSHALTQHLERPGLRHGLTYGIVDKAIVIASIFWRDGVEAQFFSFLQKDSIFLPEEADVSGAAT